MPVVQACFGEYTRLIGVETLKDWERNGVYRCELAGDRGTPRTVIAKLIKTDYRCGYSDLVSLRFLDGFADLAVTPKFYGGSAGHRLFLMEDLGGSRTMSDVFAEGSGATSQDLLCRMAVQMARQTAVTLGPEFEEEFTDLRRLYPGHEQTGRTQEVQTWRGGLTRLEALAAGLGLTISKEAALCIQQVALTYLNPEEALSFSHGDPAPTNNHIAEDGTVRLIDYEYGGYRHAYYDITGWYILCPLPLQWLSAMLEAFRQELARALPPVADNRWHARHWGYMTAYRGIAMLTWMTESVLEADRPWVGEWSARAAMISTCLRLQEATAPVMELLPLSELASQMAAALQSRFPDLGDGAIQWPGT